MLRYGAQGVGVRSADGSWSPLEYGCHLRDVLIVQRERVLLARRTIEPKVTPMGREERGDHDGYQFQDPLDVARQIVDSGQLFANVLDRLGPEDWDLTVIYNYPEPAVRDLRWLAVHTSHEVRHHLFDIHRRLR